jgi:hypothetical protein
MCGWEHDQAGRLIKRFVCGTRAAPGAHGKVGLLPFGPGFHCCIFFFPFIGSLLVVAQLENEGGSLHGQFNIKDGELCVLCFLLCFFHAEDKVRHACSVFVEEHVRAQRNNVEGVKTSRVLLKVFEEVMHMDLKEERGAILEFVDVHPFHCSTDELLAAVLSCLPIFLVRASFVDGLGLLHFNYCHIFGDLVVPDPKGFGDGK